MYDERVWKVTPARTLAAVLAALPADAVIGPLATGNLAVYLLSNGSAGPIKQIGYIDLGEERYEEEREPF